MRCVLAGPAGGVKVTHLDGIRAVYFDAGGTLIEPSVPVQEVYTRTAARFGHATDDPPRVGERFRTAFRAEEEADRRAGWATNEGREAERWRRIVAAAMPGLAPFDPCFAELYAHFGRPEAWRPLDGAGPLLAALAGRGLAVGVASNFDDRLGPIVAGHPELTALAPRLVVSSRVGWRKPALGFFAAVVASAGCDPGEILLVGDDLENDYQGARAAGLRAVLFDPRGRHPDVWDRIRRLGELLRG